MFSLDDKRFLLSLFFCLVFLFDCDPFPLLLICEGKRSNNAIFRGIRQFLFLFCRQYVIIIVELGCLLSLKNKIYPSLLCKNPELRETIPR